MFFLINRGIISVKNGLFFQEITFITEFPGSNFLLPTFLTGDKLDFQVANLLLDTVNFEPWICQEVGWKKHAEYVFTRFDSGNLGMAGHKLTFYEK